LLKFKIQKILAWSMPSYNSTDMIPKVILKKEQKSITHVTIEKIKI